VSFRLPGWGGVLQTRPTIEQQYLPCQAGLHLTHETFKLSRRRLTTEGLAFESFVTF
jgi:hypothetical protein